VSVHCHREVVVQRSCLFDDFGQRHPHAFRQDLQPDGVASGNALASAAGVEQGA
jgi:hypothetical protein